MVGPEVRSDLAFDGDESATYPTRPRRDLWVHVARGSVSVNGHPLEAGDGAAVSGEDALRFADGRDAEVLLFDMAAA